MLKVPGNEVPCCEPELVVVVKRLQEMRQCALHIKERLINKKIFLFGETEKATDKAQLKGKAPGIMGDLRETIYDLEELFEGISNVVTDIERA